MRVTIGIDIGGTKIAGGAVDAGGTILAAERAATPASDPEAIIELVAGMVTRLREGRQIAAVGVAAAAFLDAGRRRIRYAPNIAWRELPLAERLGERLQLPVILENDANAAGWAEHRFGAGAAHPDDDMVMLTLGTGVGGAIISGGRLYRGGFGAAGELGHVLLVPDGLACGCGARGCLEQYASGRALLRIAGELADAGGLGGGLARARAEHGELGAEVLGRLLRAGDAGALHALDELGGHLGRACASLAAVLDPARFVIGGGLAVAGDRLLQPVRAAFRSAVRGAGRLPEPEFVIAGLGNDAGVIGAADLAALAIE